MCRNRSKTFFVLKEFHNFNFTPTSSSIEFETLSIDLALLETRERGTECRLMFTFEFQHQKMQKKTNIYQTQHSSPAKK